jgi:hypothetical protein
MSSISKPVILWASDEVAGTQVAYSFHETAKVDSVTTATTSNKLTDSAGDFVNNGVAIGDIIHNTADDTWAIVTAVDSATALSIDTDIMADTEEYVIYSGQGYKVPHGVTEIVVILNITVDVTATADKLDVYVDTSFEDGAYGSWVNIGHFTQHDGDGTPSKYVMAFKATPPAAQTAIVDTDLAESTSLQIGFGDRIRIRGSVTEDGTAAFTFEVKAYLKTQA